MIQINVNFEASNNLVNVQYEMFNFVLNVKEPDYYHFKNDKIQDFINNVEQGFIPKALKDILIIVDISNGDHSKIFNRILESAVGDYKKYLDKEIVDFVNSYLEQDDYEEYDTSMYFD